MQHPGFLTDLAFRTGSLPAPYRVRSSTFKAIHQICFAVSMPAVISLLLPTLRPMLAALLTTALTQSIT